MSIEITDKNLSKFHKKLKNALFETFPDLNISLSQSAELFAKASGFKTSHDLQKVLSVSSNTIPNSNNESIQVLRNEFSAWKESIDKKITQYMENNPETVFQKWSWSFNDDSCFLSFCFLDDNGQKGSWYLYLNASNSYSSEENYNFVVINSDFKKIDHKKYQNDVKFLKEILSVFPHDRYRNTIYELGIKDFIDLQLSKVNEPSRSSSERLSECLIAQKNPIIHYYDRLEQDYIVIKYEDAEFGFDDTGKWVYTDAKESVVKCRTKSLKDALNNLDERSTLFERIHNNNTVKSCLFITKKDNKFFVNDVGQNLENMSFENEDDLIPFRAKQAFSEKKYDNPYYINDDRFLIWKQEHESYMKSLEPKKQVKKMLKISR